MSRLRAALLATALIAPALTGAVLGAGAAHAEPRASDVATRVITVSQVDRKNDVKVTKQGRSQLSRDARASIDLTRVKYVVDRVHNVLTVTYVTRHKPVAVKGARAIFMTMADTDARDPNAPFAIIMSRPGKVAVQVMTADRMARCAGGTGATSGAGRVHTVTVPFSCLGDVDHAPLVSAADVTGRRDDLGFDLGKRTRDLPLTTYVDPAA